MLSDPLALAARAGSAAASATVNRKLSRAQTLSSHTMAESVNVIPIHIPQHAAQQLRKLMPKVSRPSWFGALLSLFVCISLCISSILLFHYVPWFLVPLAWIVAGGALSAAHCIGRDCAYGVYTPSRVFNRIVGELVFLPLSQPFELFRIKHVPIASTPNSLATFMEELNKQQQTETESETTSTKPISRSPSGTSLSVTPAPLPVVDGLSVLFSPNARSPSSVNKTRVVTSTTLGIVFLLLTVIAIVSQAGVRGLLVYWLAPMIACRLMFATWQAFTQHVISMLPHEVSVTIASYHMLHLALSISHSIDSQLMDIRAVISYYLHRIDPVNTFIIFGVPIIAIVGFFTTPLTWPTLIWSMVFYFMSGTGITAGYHRLWAHRAYKASRPVEIYLMLCGSAALEGSIKWWCGGHRVHHRYTDTPKDPYNAQGGFWYAHLGWMLVKPDPKNRAYADIHDLRADWLIEFQHKYYLFVGPFMAIIFPTLVAGLGWGDWMGGYFYAGAARLCLVHHSTFCVNSVAHYFGAHTYDDDRSPRDHIITALLTFGEGYHNFHHEFPNDYRNGIRWYDYDPTKWLILFFNKCGLTSNLKTFSANEIARGRTTMTEKKIHLAMEKLEEEKKELRYPPSIESLPQMTWETFVSACNKHGYQWMVIQGLVHDVSSFIQDHPGGVPFIKSAIGQDGTSRFLGETGIYRHASAAHNLLSNLRIAKIGEKDEYVVPTSTTSVTETMTTSESIVVDDAIKKEQ